MSSQFELETWRVAGSGHWFIGVAGESLSDRSAVRIGLNGRIYLTDADDAATMPCMGIAITGATAAGQNVSVFIQGLVEIPGSVWTPGAALYVSTNPGALTQTAPTGGDLVQELGFALNTTQIYFNPQLSSDEIEPQGQVFTGAVESNLATDGTNQWVPFSGLSTSTAGVTRQEIINRPGTIKNARGRVSAAPGGVASRTFTLYVNGAPTALTFTISGVDVVGGDAINEVAVAVDDILLWESDGGVGVPAAARAMIACDFVPTTKIL